ncbi:hypothetical protein BY996DRAFT_6519453 [Phakopsora pachyrhizi]|nr:hypothetical protein BY996DRAFT_6519453 [Phakopsora pachyrhizi]
MPEHCIKWASVLDKHLIQLDISKSLTHGRALTHIQNPDQLQLLTEPNLGKSLGELFRCKGECNHNGKLNGNNLIVVTNMTLPFIMPYGDEVDEFDDQRNNLRNFRGEHLDNHVQQQQTRDEFISNMSNQRPRLDLEDEMIEEAIGIVLKCQGIFNVLGRPRGGFNRFEIYRSIFAKLFNLQKAELTGKSQKLNWRTSPRELKGLQGAALSEKDLIDEKMMERIRRGANFFFGKRLKILVILMIGVAIFAGMVVLVLPKLKREIESNQNSKAKERKSK